MPWAQTKVSGMNELLKETIKLKSQFNFKMYCGNDFKELFLIFENMKKMDFFEKPNYKYYNELLKACIERNKKNMGIFKYKWENIFYKIINESKIKMLTKKFQML